MSPLVALINKPVIMKRNLSFNRISPSFCQCLFIQYELVAQLSNKELCAAKATFNILDQDGDGKIKEYEVKAAFRSWFKQFEHRRNSLS